MEPKPELSMEFFVIPTGFKVIIVGRFNRIIETFMFDGFDRLDLMLEVTKRVVRYQATRDGLKK